MFKAHHTNRWHLTGLLGAVLTMQGCSSDSNDDANASAGSGGADNADSFSNAAPLPTMAGSSGHSASGNTASAGKSGTVTADNACGIGMASAKLKPVNMLVMFDRSQSMNDNGKWPNATAALTSFFQNPGADGLRVALRFFPHDEPAAGCTQDGCDAVACSQPIVPIGELTADAGADRYARGRTRDRHRQLGARHGGGNRSGGGGQGTPIYAALDGALRWGTSYQAMHSDEATVIIFVTDGEPNGCDENFDDISKLAADALANSGVKTYAIGLEGSE